ncbi:MAG: hypothetical protein DVB23_001148 [Verrucomicrobia bacterium]|nr:MAG: hypothetical protein DVB23_001148 [Verrucomicrobiota bacterium]
MIESQVLANLPPPWLALTGALTVLVVASQFVPAARFPMHAAIFFGLLAGLGWRQGWPGTLIGLPGTGASPVLGLTWLAEATLSALFLVMAIILTLGRGRGAVVALLLAVPPVVLGAGARFGGWPDVFPWPDAPWPPLSLPGSLPLGLGLLLLLAAIGCFALQNGTTDDDPASAPEPVGPSPRIILGAVHEPQDEDADEGEPWSDDQDRSAQGSGPAARAISSAGSPLRQRAIRRHRHRRARSSRH